MIKSLEFAAYRFDSFTLDLKREALITDGGNEVPLRPKTFALLRLLVENPGRLVSKDEIMDGIWGKVFVTENNVAQCIREIRFALGLQAQQTLRTRPRRGYLFSANVVPVVPADWLWFRNDNSDPAISASIRSAAGGHRLNR